MAGITFAGVGKRFGDTPVLDGIDLTIAPGEFVALLGPSGCGKSTLLRMIAGLESITTGDISIAGARINDVLPSRRGIAMVFQNYALYPHMTVRGNMEYGLKIAGHSKADITARVDKAAALLQLTDFLDRKPAQLSGGQRQRVAIGRAIVREPRVFLFDEPLSNLDASLRAATRVEIVRLKETLPGTTMVYVTHDQVEAMTMAERVVVMDRGRIAQVGSPLDLYHRPANRFVAAFIGTPAMNFLPAARIPGMGVNVAEIGIRPEHLRLAAPQDAHLTGSCLLCERLGEVTMVHLTLDDGTAIVAKLPGDIAPARGETIHLAADLARLHRFDRQGQSL
jgi:alpha-glucoside transport system ATP-binding protein